MNVLCTEMVAYTLSPCPSLHCKTYVLHITHLNPPLQLLSGPLWAWLMHLFFMLFFTLYPFAVTNLSCECDLPVSGTFCLLPNH